MILAIIDHMEHQLFLESVDENELQEKYNGEEEAYIRDKYGYKDDEKSMFTWDYVSPCIEVFGEKKNGKIKINRNS